MLPFTLEFSRLDPDEFVRAVLVERLHAAAVVVGEDFRFGHKAAGDVPLLAKLGEKYDYTAEGVPLLDADGVTISSTRSGNGWPPATWPAPPQLLGRPHRVEGVVVRGHQRGRALGFPTANLEIPPHTAIPADGVYAGWLPAWTWTATEAAPLAGRDLGRHQPDLRRHRPDRRGVRARPHDLDLYGIHAAIDFAARLRGTETLRSVEALVAQMREDVEAARALTAG